MFPSLMSKTFLILSISLTLCYLGAQAVVSYYRYAFRNKRKFVTAVKNEQGQDDLVVDSQHLMWVFWPAMIVNILCFIGLMAFRSEFPANMAWMGLFTLSDGITLGVVLISVDENLALKVAWLTALITLFAGTLGLYSNVNFAPLGKYLMWGLWILLAFLTVNLFVSIKSATQRIMSGFGVLLFTGYLLFDFNRINRLKDVELYDNWNQALGLAISIYLDIINLFLHLLRLLSKK